MDWKETDERLIRRGELILDLESLRNHEKELENMNEDRPGPRYKLAASYIQLLSATRYLYQMPYRQLEGYTRILHRLVPDLPRGDYSVLRKRILRQPIDPYRGAQGDHPTHQPTCLNLPRDSRDGHQPHTRLQGRRGLPSPRREDCPHALITRSTSSRFFSTLNFLWK